MSSRALKVMGIAVVALTGCATDDDDSVVQLGVLYEQNQTTIVSPTNVAAGSAFTVSIDTWGNSCMSADSTVIALTSDGVSITPYDKRLIPNRMGFACAQTLMAISHTASITLTLSGVETIHVLGLDAQRDMVDVPLEIAVE